MARYRKKQGWFKVVEAIPLTRFNWSEMCDHAAVGKLSDGKPEGKHPTRPRDKLTLSIPTSEGLVIAYEHDWVIREFSGEISRCAPKIFKAAYQRVSNHTAVDG